MGANKTRRAVRAAALGARVGEYASWDMVVACEACRSQRLLDMAGFPAELTVGALVQRLRCRLCRGRPGQVLLNNRLTGWRAATVRLVGEGSYG